MPDEFSQYGGKGIGRIGPKTINDITRQSQSPKTHLYSRHQDSKKKTEFPEVKFLVPFLQDMQLANVIHRNAVFDKIFIFKRPVIRMQGQVADAAAHGRAVQANRFGNDRLFDHRLRSGRVHGTVDGRLQLAVGQGHGAIRVCLPAGELCVGAHGRPEVERGSK